MRTRGISVIIVYIFVIGLVGIHASALALSPKEIYQRISPGVVFIYASEGSGKGSGGTGSIISRDGLVITNAHIFARDSSRVISDLWIFLKPERITGNHKKDLTRRYRARIVAYDLDLDLALLKIVDTDTALTQVSFGDSEKMTVGDQAYAIGHPEQGGLWSLTTGVISAHRSDYGGISGKDLFQTEASINRGNSGGPLLNEQGRMIGINSMIARKAADGLTITDVNFAIKSNVALRWLNGKGYRFAAAWKPTTEMRPKPAKEEPQTAKEPVQPVKETPSPAPKPPQEGKGGRVLTEKKPYNLDELIAGMQEMEDMMEEMRGTIKEFKKRRR
ncbi:MAG: serine protease [Deltaproteobacteria bacterium]|nr:MAG: serine protease [Deltaproteobacteria bacterium]